jgi:hypothetical protein
VLIDLDLAQVREIVDDVLPLQIPIVPHRQAIEELLRRCVWLHHG